MQPESTQSGVWKLNVLPLLMILLGIMGTRLSGPVLQRATITPGQEVAQLEPETRTVF
jgi:hypothetical protein